MEVHYRSRLASLLLPRRYIAITLGRHVFTPLATLSEDVLRHERVHVEQWRRLGALRFLTRYLWYHCKYGYQQNPFEVEARAAE